MAGGGAPPGGGGAPPGGGGTEPGGGGVELGGGGGGVEPGGGGIPPGGCVGFPSGGVGSDMWSRLEQLGGCCVQLRGRSKRYPAVRGFPMMVTDALAPRPIV